MLMDVFWDKQKITFEISNAHTASGKKRKNAVVPAFALILTHSTTEMVYNGFVYALQNRYSKLRDIANAHKIRVLQTTEW